MCTTMLAARIDHITIEEPEKWSLIYLVDKSLRIVRKSKPYEELCGNVSLYSYDQISQPVIDRLKIIISKVLENHSDPGISGGFIVTDISTGRNVFVKYKNTIPNIVKLVSSTELLAPIFFFAEEIVAQANYDDMSTPPSQ